MQIIEASCDGDVFEEWFEDRWRVRREGRDFCSWLRRRASAGLLLEIPRDRGRLRRGSRLCCLA